MPLNSLMLRLSKRLHYTQRLTKMRKARLCPFSLLGIYSRTRDFPVPVPAILPECFRKAGMEPGSITGTRLSELRGKYRNVSKQPLTANGKLCLNGECI